MRSFLQMRTALLALALAGACGDPDDDLDMSGGPAQAAEAGLSDGAIAPPIGQPEAGIPPGFDAAVGAPDAGNTGMLGDASAVVPGPEAGSVFDSGPAGDAGDVQADAGARDDASTGGGDAGPCATLTYASFGMQFMTSYCTSCHSGARAPDGVMLDTLAGIQQRKAAIKMQAVTMTAMPPQNPRPSAADRQKLGQWLDCGPN